MSERVVARVNLWSAMLDVADMPSKPSAADAKAVICTGGQVHPYTELTLEVTDANQWIIRIHGVESEADAVKVTFARSGHVAVETNVVQNDMVVTRRVAW